MSITELAIKKNRVTFLIIVVILIAGLRSLFNLPRAEDPGFIVRIATIVTVFPGASPSRIEQLITNEIEKKVQEIPELDHVRSEMRDGFSITYIVIKETYSDMVPIWDSLKSKIDGIKTSLPQGIYGPFVNDDYGDVFGTVLAISGEGISYKELEAISSDVKDELLRLPQTAKVNIYGKQEQRIFIEFNNTTISLLGISPFQLKEILKRQNIIIPGGSINTDDEKLVLEPSGNFESIDELKKTIIGIPGRSDTIFLSDIAKVYRGYVDPPKTKMRSNSRRAIALGVSLKEGGNIILLGEQVKNVMNKLKANYPIGVEFDFICFQPNVVDKKVSGFISNLYQSIAIVFITVLLFLGLRTGLLVASLIPSAMLMGLMFMGVFDIGLNQVSLAALIISLGMLVDNSIVMVESIMIMVEQGKNIFQATIDSAKELRISLLTSSLTTAASFLPIYLAKSKVGEYTAPIFQVVAITLLCSWILSITMIPLLCNYFLKVPKKVKPQSFDSRFYILYRGILKTILRFKYISLVLTFLIFFVSLMGFRFIPKTFFPANERPLLKVTLNLPLGTPIKKTEQVVSKIEKFIHKTYGTGGSNSKIINFASYIGESGPRFTLNNPPTLASPEYAFMLINLRKFSDLNTVKYAIEKYCFENFPDLMAEVGPLKMGPPVNKPVEIRIFGKEIKNLFEISHIVKEKLSSIKGTKNIADDWGGRTKKIVVKVNQLRAKRAGVTSQDIAVSLQTILSGIEVTQFRENDKAIPIIIRSIKDNRSDLGRLETLSIYSIRTGKSIPLKQVADLKIEWGPSKIMRRDRSKVVTVSSTLSEGVTAKEVVDKIRPWLEKESKKWGVGYRFMFGGEIESSVKANASIMAELPLAAFIILLLLVLQFNSFRKPLIILLTIPLGIIGVVVGLIVGKSYFGFMTLLGVVSLSGIVINNAIVLIDRIQLEIDEFERTLFEAIVEAAQRRLRPILLTTVTTIGGLIPLWAFGGLMWEPMALAIIFGLLVATVLTLGVVPVLYSIFYKVKQI